MTDAARALAARLRPHTTVLVESAVPPGTTENVVRPLLEEGSGLRAGRDFHLAHSPGRLDPGNRTHVFGNTPKVIGGLTPACTESAAAFYGRLTDKVVRARGPREAEMTKVLETNFRHVNIALVNEMAVLCHDLGVDLWDVIRCAETKPFGFEAFRPGPGVGGHAAPVDPGCFPYYSRTPGHPLRMVSLAKEINDRMPSYVIQRCATLLNEHGKSVRGPGSCCSGSRTSRTSPTRRPPPRARSRPGSWTWGPRSATTTRTSWTGACATCPYRAPTPSTRRRLGRI